MSRADAIVVGGGVIGCSVAWFLAREGLRVTLLERDDVAVHASGAAAGMLRPLGEAPEPGPFATWALRSCAMYPELVAELLDRSGVDPEYKATGVLEVAHDEESAARLRRRAETFAPDGAEWLDAATARTEAGVAPDVLGGFWSPSEAHIRSPLLSRACAAAAVELGARLETGAPVVGLLREGERVVGVRTADTSHHAAVVVLCMGTWTPAFADWLGRDWQLPIEPVRGQILSLAAPQPPLRSVLVGHGVYLVPRLDGTVVVGATEERVGFDCRVTADGLSRLLTAAPRVAPSLADASFRTAWAGLRPATPDRMAVIGPVPGVDGLLLAAGHYRNGVLLAPITAQLIRDLILGKTLPPEAAPFSPARFL